MWRCGGWRCEGQDPVLRGRSLAGRGRGGGRGGVTPWGVSETGRLGSGWGLSTHLPRPRGWGRRGPQPSAEAGGPAWWPDAGWWAPEPGDAEETGCLDRRRCAHLSLNFPLGTLKTLKHRELSYCSLHSFLPSRLCPDALGSGEHALRGGRVGTQGGGGRGHVLCPSSMRGRRVGVEPPARLGAGSSPV